MFFVLSVKFSSFVLPLFPFPFLHSFLSVLCFFHFSLSLSLSFFLSFFRLSILCVFISFLLPSLLPCFLPSFLHSPLLPFFLPSFLLSSTDSFLSSFHFFSFCPVSSLGCPIFRQMAADGVLEGHFCYLLVGWYRCVELLLLGWVKKENPAYFTLIRVFFQILGSLLSARYDLLWWVFSSSIMILLRSTVPCSTSSRCVWLYPHLCCELLSCVGPTA